MLVVLLLPAEPFLAGAATVIAATGVLLPSFTYSDGTLPLLLSSLRMKGAT